MSTDAAKVRGGDGLTRATGRHRRYAECVLFVASWVGLGLLLRLQMELYLVTGVPITFAFQRFVRRQPLRAMWVISAPPFRLDRKGKVIALVLAAIPLVSAVGAAAFRQWATCAWSVCATGGAIPAAYALRHFRRTLVRPLLACLSINIVLAGLILTALSAWGVVKTPGGAPSLGVRFAVGIVELMVFIPVVFVMEEVSFRGVLDAHLHRPGEGRGWGSALFISALWGLWHLPIAGDISLQRIGMLLFVHCPIGVVLSLYWRRTGTLVIPGASHALLDALRDALLSAG
jgi:membrane protease YdiL (CAAX protease family)